MSPPLDDHKVPFDVVNSWYEFPLHEHRPYAFNSLLCFNNRIFFNQVELGWIALFMDDFFLFPSLSMWMLLDLDCKLISYWILNWDMSSLFISLRMKKTEICVSVLMWVTARVFSEKLYTAIVCNSSVVFLKSPWDGVCYLSNNSFLILVKTAYIIFQYNQQYLWETSSV